MSDYETTIDWLYSQLPMFSVVGAGAYKPGLDTAYTLDDAFGNPSRAFRSIHIAGTNGKGSTSHMLASVLMATGLKVGLYTSPHIYDFRERIRINGEMIAKEAVVDFVGRYRALDLDCNPSFFELTTIMAFDYFATKGVDIVVVETGLGGRLDTTNIITPELSVITNVSLDHTAQLGNTHEEIAAEKGGIIKEGIPVVVGNAQGGVRDVFADIASRRNAPIVFAQDTPVVDDSIDCDLKGEFQNENINTVRHALETMGVTDHEAIKSGLEHVVENTGLFGRWSTATAHGREVIVDTGHNIGAWQILAPTLAKIAETRKVHMVLGFVNDKDIEPIFDILPKDAKYYFVTPATKRARPAESLQELGMEHGLQSRAFDVAADGLDAAIAEAGADDVVFVGGSNYLISSLTQIVR